MVLMLVVAGATLAVFAAMERGNARNQRYNESQPRSAWRPTRSRSGCATSPARRPGSAAADQQPLERANAKDLVFRAVNSEGAATANNPQNLQRYRYCLGTTTKRLYVQRQTWTGVMPATPGATACPGSGGRRRGRSSRTWSTAAARCSTTSSARSPAATPRQTTVAAADHPITVAVRTTLWVDPDPVHKPAETTLSTRVFLRNQNRPPLARSTCGARQQGDAERLGLRRSRGQLPALQFFDNGSRCSTGDRRADRRPAPARSTPTSPPPAPTATRSRHGRRQAHDDVDPAVDVPCTTASSTTTCTALLA